MRKWWLLFLVSIVITACDNQEPTSTSGDERNVEVVVPASVNQVTEEEMDKLTDQAETDGMEVSRNDDGSLTYRMSAVKQQDILDELSADMDLYMREVKASETFPSIQDLTYQGDTQIEMVVDQEQYEAESNTDSVVPRGLAAQVMVYHLYAGEDIEEQHITIEIKNTAGEVIDTAVYPSE